MLAFEVSVADGPPISCRLSDDPLRCGPHCAALCTEAGLAAAYRAYAPVIAAFCRRVVQDPWLAEELMQEVFVKAWRNCARFDDRLGLPGEEERLRPWLFTIARNAAIDAARRRDRQVPMRLRPEQVDHVDPFDTYSTIDDADLVRAGLATLSPAHCASVVAVFLEDLSYAQAAARLGVPVGTVKSRVFSALRALRAALGNCDERVGSMPA